MQAEDELRNLKGVSHYVAGFTEAEIVDKEQYYDILVDCASCPCNASACHPT